VTVWIVDYDLRANNSRRSFYRHVKAWLQNHNIEKDVKWSTYSVVITEDREFAEFVYAEASQLGRANLYEAKQVKSSLPEDLAEKALGLVTCETS
jgi:hypothetical protein